MTTTFVTDAGVDVGSDVGDDDVDYDGWFCISTSPFQCPAPGCGFVAHHATAAHRVLVWTEKDDDRLLDLAVKLQAVERHPKVVDYEVSMGPCLAYDQWEALGRPVHAILRNG